MMDYKMKKSKVETKEGKNRFSPVRVTDARFNSILKKNPAVLIDFWADWCGPCRIMSPVVEKAAVQYQDRFKFCKINVDANPGMANQYQV